MSFSLQNIAVVGGLILILGLGYYLYDKNKDSTLSTENEMVNTQVSVASADFLRKLNELKALSFDDDIFDDPRFESLVDRRPPLVPETVGRSNPFISVE